MTVSPTGFGDSAENTGLRTLAVDDETELVAEDRP